VLALLASVALPGFAQAAPKLIPEYDNPETHLEVHHTTTKPKHKVSHTPSSTAPGTEGSAVAGTQRDETAPPAEEPEGGGEPEKQQVVPVAPGGGGGKPGGGEGAKPRAKRVGKPEDAIGGARKVESPAKVPPAPAPRKAASGIGGGSSPVLPILIAVIALAALSVGATFLRQRRSDRKLGGSPGSV
jgi:hypothetical protein